MRALHPAGSKFLNSFKPIVLCILEKRQGVKISCIEEIAFRMKYIGKGALLTLGEKMKNNPYGKYLISIAENS